MTTGQTEQDDLAEVIVAAQLWDSLNSMKQMVAQMEAQFADMKTWIQTSEQAMQQLLVRARVGGHEPIK